MYHMTALEEGLLKQGTGKDGSSSKTDRMPSQQRHLGIPHYTYQDVCMPQEFMRQHMGACTLA